MVSTKPVRTILCQTCTRILDVGGWTDTWFAGHGRIFNIGVNPGVTVQIKVFPKDNHDKERVKIVAESYGEVFFLNPEQLLYQNENSVLLEAALQIMRVPQNLRLEINIHSLMPQGAGVGTSAAVTTALIAGLDRLTSGRLAPHEVAAKAHQVETEILELQCGIQDQHASVFGNINFIDMAEYPHAIISQLSIPKSIHWDLERRLLLFYLGSAHSSSKIHEQVIAELEKTGSGNSNLARLRKCANDEKNALYEGNMKKFGIVMQKNTDVQRALHPSLISIKSNAIIEIAQRYGASGWKVNGAGGDGGSITILAGPDDSNKRKMIKAVEELGQGIKYIPITIATDGLRVWETK